MSTIYDLLRDAIADPLGLVPFVAAISLGLVVLALAGPIVEARRRAHRLASVAAAEVRMRDTAQARRAEKTADPVASLRHKAPRRLYSAIVERLKLDRLLKNPATVKLIHQAGFRAPAAAIKIVALRVLLALGFGALAVFYVWVVFDLPYPLPVRVILVAGAAALGWWGPILYLKNRLQKRRQEVRRNWPDAMDLMLICVESGMSVEAAFRKVAEEIAAQSIVLSEELSLTTAELNYLPDRQRAFRRLAQRVETDAVRATVTALLQSEKYGTPVGQALRVLSRESRDLRMAEAEKKAAALPPKLTVPMILFFLPVLFAVIMTPAIIRIMAE